MWNTLYIKGNGKFKDSIRKNLSKSKLSHGEDYIEGSSHHNFILYWTNPSLNIRDFKLAIKAKCIWKHRLEFSSKIEINNISPTALTQSEKDLMSKYKNSYENNIDKKNM